MYCLLFCYEVLVLFSKSLAGFRQKPEMSIYLLGGWGAQRDLRHQPLDVIVHGPVRERANDEEEDHEVDVADTHEKDLLGSRCGVYGPFTGGGLNIMTFAFF